MAKGRSYYQNLARQAAQAAGIDENIFLRQIDAESGFNPRAGSSAGAKGIAQIMTDTARGWGVDPWNPRAALYAAARADAKYLKSYGGNWRHVLTAYNAGPGRVGKPLYGETRAYIDKILGSGGATRSIRSTGSSAADTTLPASGVSPQAAALAFIMQGSPFEGLVGVHEPATDFYPAAPWGGSTRRIKRPHGADRNYLWLQRKGRELYGLRNDPGDSQTTGGRHTKNSRHFARKAVDFGDALNTDEQLAGWYAWLKRNRKRLGLAEVIDEGDHVHASF